MDQSSYSSAVIAAINAATKLRHEATAEQLHGLLVQGTATSTAVAMTIGTPAELAVMVADLAARLAAVGDLPPDAKFSISVDFQPWLRDAADRSEGIAAIDQLLSTVLPGIAGVRDRMSDGVTHYRGRGQTAAGLGVSVYTDVPSLPSDQPQ